ncbi:unnamed protein product [Gordionus sp. m RMFG-2023]|uniref:insulin-induced gene 1 protein-like n=1 Tax=Gordionus sp. m RMFG-2023 TaxID=3053472 RepID=UPI0030E5EDE6
MFYKQFSCLIRASILFTIGVLTSLILNLLQVQRNITIFPKGSNSNLLYTVWWVPPSCGLVAVIVGLLYPFLDEIFGEKLMHTREWSSIMRCVAVFFGINHASVKIDFANNMQFSLTLAALSVGLWWLFDRSRIGFLLGLVIAFITTLICQLLVYNGIYEYTEPDFIYVRSWLPCIFFSGAVTIGNIGRQLAMCDSEEYDKDGDD